MKPNISLVNALIRIACGLTVISWSTARLSRRPHHSSYLFMTMMGALKVAEGITRFCPLTLLMQNYIDDDLDSQDKKKELTMLNQY
ncbi:YgaP family membrane protein [Priestia endophytica]|uniref:YgaP family membrane protein n=1 Tax=Priestia endophytica TaxID=135735 RepID=UPI0022832A80|nr:DUF2892 domain-containing protein [Priestia endophytica]MCY8234847.1 DUF2892 domain-containing protein [Priestia endophytica]